MSANGKALLPVSQLSEALYDGMPYFTDTIDLIRTQETGAAVARALGSCKAVLMRNHGVAVVGRTVEESTILAIMLDTACRIQLLAEAAGGIGPLFEASDIQRLHDNITRAEQYAVNFEYLRRRAFGELVS